MGDIRANISKNILYFRKNAGLTQKELAEQLGVKLTSVSSWERGANAPDIETLYRICEFFHTTLDEMYGVGTTSQMAANKTEGTPEEITSDSFPPYEGIQLLIARNGNKLTDSEKLQIIKMLSELK